jgi:hypothetical protein
MSRFSLVVVAAAIAAAFPPAPATAQEAPRGEAFGAFQWVYDSDVVGSLNMIGVYGEVTGYVNDWFGIGGEFGWARDELGGGLTLSAIPFGAGPRFRFPNDSIVTPSARVMIGAWRLAAEGESETWFATTFGGAVDVRVSDRVSVRAQPDLVIIYITDDDPEPVFRLTAGVVIGF